MKEKLEKDALEQLAKMEITINEEFVLINPDGSFSKEINLKNGLNAIVITAKKKYSRQNNIIRNILVTGHNDSDEY